MNDELQFPPRNLVYEKAKARVEARVKTKALTQLPAIDSPISITNYLGVVFTGKVTAAHYDTQRCCYVIEARDERPL
ncbi:MAG TPA: hypothetical protein VGP72_16480 [Planctomycetota bacterium]|jgi:hypothetical protein